MSKQIENLNQINQLINLYQLGNLNKLEIKNIHDSIWSILMVEIPELSSVESSRILESINKMRAELLSIN